MFVNALLSQHSSTPSTAWGNEGGKALVAQLLCCLYVGGVCFALYSTHEKHVIKQTLRDVLG